MVTTLKAMAEAVRDWTAAAADMLEFSRLDTRSREVLAREQGLSVGALAAVIANRPGSARLMGRVMAAIGLEPDEVRRYAPDLMQDLTATCARCGARDTCRRALAAATVQDTLDRFCPNAPVLRELAG